MGLGFDKQQQCPHQDQAHQESQNQQRKRQVPIKLAPRPPCETDSVRLAISADVLGVSILVALPTLHRRTAGGTHSRRAATWYAYVTYFFVPVSSRRWRGEDLQSAPHTGGLLHAPDSGAVNYRLRSFLASPNALADSSCLPSLWNFSPSARRD